MTVLALLGAVGLAGGAGGVVNALLSDNGFMLPRTEEADRGYIIRPGVIGNIIVGTVAAGISWGLYGPLGNVSIFANPPDGLTLSGLLGAILVGIGGARWLTNEVDKKLLRAAAGNAAAAPASPNVIRQMQNASPAQVLSLAKSLHRQSNGGKPSRA